MAEANEALLKFSVDINEVNREIQRALKGSINTTTGGTSGGSPASGTAGGGISAAASGVASRAGGGIGLNMGGGSPIGMALQGAKFAIDRTDAIMRRRNDYTTAQVTALSQANAGLTTGSVYQQQTMQAGMKNAMGFWGGIPILSGRIQARMQQDPRYQSFMTDMQKQQNIDADIVGSVTGFYSRARAEGYKPSQAEMARVAKVSEALAQEKQGVRDFANKFTQNRGANVNLERRKQEFLDDSTGFKVLSDIVKEQFADLKTLLSGDFLTAFRSALGG